ncbi:hypothetical protein N7493_006146 [Penicillium malachiteum]|uniref:Aminoglycoside phosphotransferase domain-containing protein n=1 Tax=Penicillium malachiteum TaxID=1324776 RepID=A0AAD6HKP8_9EURO|nr:hypothetical protein N7493_006146 [Penicillium malachiteum]
MKPRMHYDDAAWEKSEEIQDTWALQFLDPRVLEAVGDFVTRHQKPDEVGSLRILSRGGFNISLKMEYEKDSVVMHFPLPGATMFPEEKVQCEVDTMRFIRDQTWIPVPFVLHWGSKQSSPLQLGPFIIMHYIEHEESVYNALNTSGTPKSERGRIDLEIDENKLEALYGELAEILLQLSKPSLPKIGSLRQVDDLTWESPLADLHMAHLYAQQNDSIDSSDDCRRKFIARSLFRKLAREEKLTKQGSPNNGPFKLWCDDFRPANVLINKEFKITGVMNWEFTYAVPIEFTHAPPWWLPLEKPEYWPDEKFLKALELREEAAIHRGWLKDDERLSGPMRESWETGDFWIGYAARCNFAFDAIYWQKIDQ